jgi:acetolactate synthase-1/2/3 large subunit
VIVGEVVGEFVAKAGIRNVYLLSGGHIFPIIDALHKRGIRIVDTRHEQSAGFAAEAAAKLHARPAIAVVTAGPGVTNCVSPLASALKSEVPLVVLAGRAPQNRWGQGSLQEFEHLEVVKGATKWCATLYEPASAASLLHKAFEVATTPPKGPVFLDFPLDVLISQIGDLEIPPAKVSPSAAGDGQEAAKAVSAALERHPRAVFFLGSQVWMNGAAEAARLALEGWGGPVITNSLARGIIPPGSACNAQELRHRIIESAELVVVVGAPLDFRLNFGRLGSAKVAHITDSEASLSRSADLELALAADLEAFFSELAETLHASPASETTRRWWEETRAKLSADARATGKPSSNSSSAAPEAAMHMKMSECVRAALSVLPDDAIVIGDGGDFVSYLGRLHQPMRPGLWLDSGPFGCLGSGMGYAIGAKAERPDADVVVFEGDGALGFCLAELDTLARHRLGAVVVVGNNGIWGLEKHPMRMFYGYDVAADLNQNSAYEEVARALGGDGERVKTPDEVAKAVERGLARAREGVPYLVNALIDPQDTYPRRANLA